MPIQHFQIYLDKQNEPYRSSEHITGKFVIVVTDGYDHKGIYLKFEGHGMIQWTEERSCFEESALKQHRARRQFFDSMFKYASEEHLPEGTHIFPFEYTLPANLPSSFSTQTNTVWYKMEALLNKEPKPRREVLLFAVQGVVDLNEDANLKNPISKVKSKNLMGFFPPFLCTCHHVSIGIKLLQQGFVPGDKISCILACFSETMPLTDVTLGLYQEITLVTKEKTMIERRTTLKLILPDISPEEGDDYRRWEQKIAIPNDILVTSVAKEYDTVKIQYFIKFSVEATNFPYKDLQTKVPITIGTVPLIPDEEEIPEFDYDSLDEQSEDYSSIPRIVIEDSDKVKDQEAGTSTGNKYDVDMMDSIRLSSDTDDEGEQLELHNRKIKAITKELESESPSCGKDLLKSPSHHSKSKRSPSLSEGGKKTPSHSQSKGKNIGAVVGDSNSPKVNKAFDAEHGKYKPVFINMDDVAPARAHLFNYKRDHNKHHNNHPKF